jgi:carbon-monoxide dehydrogenase iron sulfur subunit
MKRIFAREEYCLGCRLCEINCLVKHSRSKKIIKAFRTERDAVVPRVRVEEVGRVSFALQCRHCDEAPCIEACIAGAMHRDGATGAVLCDEDRCVGCWSCIMVCPAGAVLRGKERKVASKCDLCADEDVPVCVAGCPNEALILEDSAAGEDRHEDR